MLEKVGIVCFASCYAIAMVVELVRTYGKPESRRLASLELLLLGAGILVHTAYLSSHALAANSLSSQRDCVLVLDWILACASLAIISTYRSRSFGIVLLPVTLAVLGIVRAFPENAGFAARPLSAVWGVIHGVSMMLAAAGIFCGFLSGVCYLRKSWLLKHPTVKSRWALPSLEWLHYANRHSMKFSAVTLGLGVLSGLVLMRLSGKPQLDWMTLATLALFAWFALTLFAGFFWKWANAGHQIAYRTILTFVALLVIAVLGIQSKHPHGKPVPQTAPAVNAPATENATEKPTAEEPANGENPTAESANEPASTEQPTTREPANEPTSTEQPTTGEPAAKSPVTEETSAANASGEVGEPAVNSPTTEENSTEESAAKAPAAEETTTAAEGTTTTETANVPTEETPSAEAPSAAEEPTKSGGAR